MIGLLVLVACQKRDPAGTLTPTENPFTTVPAIILNSTPGENLPMRLVKGKYRVLVSHSDEMDVDLYEDCDLKVELRKYRKEEGVNIYSQMALGSLDLTEVVVAEPGVYQIWIAARHERCAPTLVFQPPDA